MEELIIQNPFETFCWSNIDQLVEMWYKWIRGILRETTSLGTKHRSNLPPWVTSSTSHLIKKLHTAKKQNRKSKIEKLDKVVSLALVNDQKSYEEHLSDGRNTNRLFKFIANRIALPCHPQCSLLMKHTQTSAKHRYLPNFSQVFISSPQNSIQTKRFQNVSFLSLQNLKST